MSVLYPEQWPHDGRGHVVPLACWYCHAPLDATYPAVQWTGGDGDMLTLHHTCIPSLAMHLAGDQRECELAAGTAPHWAARAARAASEPLYREYRAGGTALPLRSYAGTALP